MKNFLAISIVLVSIAAYNLWPVLDCYYEGIALTFVLCASLIVKIAEKGSLVRRVGLIFLLLSINNLLDEIFFDPKSFGLNEYAISAVIIVHQLYLHQNARNTNQ